jgi:CHAT domain-containing protein
MARGWYLFLSRLHAVLRQGAIVVKRFNVFQYFKLWNYTVLAVLTCLLCLVTQPGMAILMTSDHGTVQTRSDWTTSDALIIAQGMTTADLLSQSRQLYEQGQYAEAASLLEQVVDTTQSQGRDLEAAIALSNLSLTYQHLGRWDEAETAIATSLSILDTPDAATDPNLLAQALNVQGRLQFYRGNAEAALATWERVAELFDQADDPTAIIRAQLNQAEAFQAMGMYRRAVGLLTDVRTQLSGQPDSPEQALMLQRLGDALRVAGDLNQSEATLQASRAMAERLGLPEAIAATTLGLGNTAYARGDFQTAQDYYQQASTLAPTPLLQVQANLNRLRTLLDLNQAEAAASLMPALSGQIEQLPPGRAAIYARINLSDSLLRLADLKPELASQSSDLPTLATFLAIAVDQAQDLQDLRSQSYALGALGKVYEQAEQWEDAEQLTDQAFLLAQQVNAPELRYLWEWQLGRILAGQEDRQNAIAAYTSAINTLQLVRRDLAAINPEAQFSFRQSVEPIHRELVSLLLADNANVSNEELEQARFTIESLQLAELDNFFREACLNAREVQIDTIDQQAAVLYPIILRDRLEVILALPGQPLTHHSVPVTEAEVTTLAQTLSQNLRDYRRTAQVQRNAETLYTWLIEPVRETLDASPIQTLVFVPDGILRNIPMAALYDGEEYLIENYAIALAPTLQLLEAGRIQPDQFSILLGGLTESRQDFTPLPGVEAELEQIREKVPGQIILNQDFTDEAVKAAIDEVPYPVVHLATHGEFSSNLEDTFILTWNDRLDINELNSLLQATDINRQVPIELLVLSACRTAAGDDRATLGLAGMAVRSGARSTIASLWYVSDDATSRLMVRFYENLATGTMTKAEALRQAQISMIQVEDIPNNTSVDFYPYYWSAFVLIGNWL